MIYESFSLGIPLISGYPVIFFRPNKQINIGGHYEIVFHITRLKN